MTSLSEQLNNSISPITQFTLSKQYGVAKQFILSRLLWNMFYVGASNAWMISSENNYYSSNMGFKSMSGSDFTSFSSLILFSSSDSDKFGWVDFSLVLSSEIIEESNYVIICKAFTTRFLRPPSYKNKVQTQTSSFPLFSTLLFPITSLLYKYVIFWSIWACRRKWPIINVFMT